MVVATLRALKHHGGAAPGDLGREDLGALERGLANLQRHVHNVRDVYGLPCVVAVNHFSADTAAEHALLAARVADWGVPLHLCRHWAEGGRGAADLAHTVVRLCAEPSTMRFVYPGDASLLDKASLVAQRVYGAAGVSASAAVRAQLQALEDGGHRHLPVCIAKTQFSFSTDTSLLGAPCGHVLNVREVRLAAGAGFVTLVCGDIVTMPGLPAAPAAERIDLDDAGQVVGLF